MTRLVKTRWNRSKPNRGLIHLHSMILPHDYVLKLLHQLMRLQSNKDKARIISLLPLFSATFVSSKLKDEIVAREIVINKTEKAGRV